MSYSLHVPSNHYVIQIDSYLIFRPQKASSIFKMVSEAKELKPEHNADTVDVTFD